MQRKLLFTPTADAQLTGLAKHPATAGIFKQVRKALGFLEQDPRHPGLRCHEFTALSAATGIKVYEAYAQNDIPGAYRIFWHYGPDEFHGKVRTPVITIIAITPHP